MGFRIGQGYFGSPDKMISVENQEIIQPHKPLTWTTNFNAYKFSFKPSMDCHVKINGGDAIFFEANHWFSTDYMDKEINTFVIVEPNIEFIYTLSY